MKRAFILLTGAFLLLLSACTKEEPAMPEEGKEYSLTFNLNAFSQEIVPMSGLGPAQLTAESTTSGKALAEVIGRYDYVVYNEAGKKLREKATFYDEADFGTISDRLPKGKYRILIVGSRHHTHNVPQSLSDQEKIYNWDLSDDVFFKLFDVEVSGSDIEQNTQLKRKVGRLEIDFTGKIPPHIGQIKYTLSGVSEYFTPTTNKGSNTRNLTRTANVDHEGNFYGWGIEEQFNFYYFLDEDKETTATITLVAFDRSQNVVAIKSIENVPVGINRRTKVRGNLFE